MPSTAGTLRPRTPRNFLKGAWHNRIYGGARRLWSYVFQRAPFRHLIGATNYLGVKLYSLALCYRAFVVSRLFSVRFLMPRCHCSQLLLSFLVVFSGRCSEPVLSTYHSPPKLFFSAVLQSFCCQPPVLGPLFSASLSLFTFFVVFFGGVFKSLFGAPNSEHLTLTP